MKPTDAIPYIGFHVDTAQSPDPFPLHEGPVTLVGWQCGFVLMFVAVRCYLGTVVGYDEAVELATDYLKEANWFGFDDPRGPDHLLKLPNEHDWQKAVTYWYAAKAKSGDKFRGHDCMIAISAIWGEDVSTDVGVATGFFEEEDLSLAADLKREREATLHKDGPWTFHPYAASSGQAGFVEAYDLTGICELQTEDPDDYSIQELANGRLIAAAPNLYLAARCALADLEGLMPDQDPSGDREHPAWKTIEELRKAIHKAEGNVDLKGILSPDEMAAAAIMLKNNQLTEG
jgi:hypothetical protein